MTIGGNLKKLRVAQGLTRDQLAEKLHVTRQAVSNWERNVSHPDLDQLEAIAAALGVEVTILLYGPPQPEAGGGDGGAGSGSGDRLCRLLWQAGALAGAGVPAGISWVWAALRTSVFRPRAGLAAGHCGRGRVGVAVPLDVGAPGPAEVPGRRGGVPFAPLGPAVGNRGVPVDAAPMGPWGKCNGTPGRVSRWASAVSGWQPGAGEGRRLEKKKRSPAPVCAEDRFAVSQLVFTGGSG